MNVFNTRCEYVRFLPLTLRLSDPNMHNSQILDEGRGVSSLPCPVIYSKFPARSNIDTAESQNKILNLRTFSSNIFNCMSSINHLPIEIMPPRNQHPPKHNSIECHQTHRNRPLWRFTGFAILKQSQNFSRGLKRINYAYKTLWRGFFGDFLYV